MAPVLGDWIWRLKLLLRNAAPTICAALALLAVAVAVWAISGGHTTAVVVRWLLGATAALIAFFGVVWAGWNGLRRHLVAADGHAQGLHADNWLQGQDAIIAGSVNEERAKELFGEWEAPRPYRQTVPDERLVLRSAAGASINGVDTRP